MDGFTIIGDPELNRTRFFVKAVQSAGFDARILPYREALASPALSRAALKDRLVKIESPGRCLATEIALLRRGAVGGPELFFSSIGDDELNAFQRDPGRLHASRQWYLGWRDFLSEMETAGGGGAARFINAPAEIAVMFDKVACRERLTQAGIPVPAALSSPSGFDELKAQMDQAGWSRAFLKPSHGSGGSGVMALALKGNQCRATTGIELVEDTAGIRLYASRRVRTYTDGAAIRKLIDVLCRERLHVEAWVPKAGLQQKTFDVRVVVIGGHSRHLTLRLADGPITNLHLGAQKADEDLLRDAGGGDCVALVRSVAESAARCFPGSLIAGIDLAVTPGFRQAFVLEVNAFGDLLEGVAWEGKDTYAWQVSAALERLRQFTP